MPSTPSAAHTIRVSPMHVLKFHLRRNSVVELASSPVQLCRSLRVITTCPAVVLLVARSVLSPGKDLTRPGTVVTTSFYIRFGAGELRRWRIQVPVGGFLEWSEEEVIRIHAAARYDNADLENPDDAAVCSLVSWGHPDAGHDLYFLVTCERENSTPPNVTGLTVVDATTWEFRKHQKPRIKDLNDANPRLRCRYPNNLRVLIAFQRRSQQRY